MSTIDLIAGLCYRDGMYDLVAMGDITLDLFFKGECLTEEKDRFHLAIGGKYPVNEFHVSIGGGGANVAVGSAANGLTAAVCGMIGENVFRQIILQQLGSRHVGTEFLMYDMDYYNLSAILLAKSGERTIVHYVCPTDFTVPKSILAKIEESKALYMGNMRSLSSADKLRLLSHFKKSGLKIFLNLGIGDCRKKLSEVTPLIKAADILFLNTYEFAALVKKARDKIDFKKDCCSMLGFDEQILVLTDGAGGSYIYQNASMHHEPAVSVSTLIDSTGAGDAYVSAFISSYLKGSPLDEAAHSASHFAAKIITRLGA